MFFLLFSAKISFRVTIRHQRYKSDIDRSSLASPVQAAQLLSEDQQKRSFKLPWSFEKYLQS